MKKFLDCISVVGSTPSRFQGTKKYVSTGAVATTEIDESEVVEVSYEDRPSRANLTAEAGDILFAKMQGTRKTLLLDSETEENIYSTGFYAVRANPEIITTECLYYLVDSELFLAQKDKNCSGATQKAITNGGLAKIEIRIPPLSEQAALTEKLRYLTQLIADRKKQLELFDEVIKSRFIEMFGDCKESRKLEDYAVLITKGASPKWQGFDYCDEGVLFVTSENVREGFLDLSKRKYLPQGINDILPRSVLKKNDILINIVNASIGRAAIYDSDELANINQAVALVRLKPDVLNLSFLLTYLNSDEACASYDFMKVGGDKANLSLKNISDLKIPVASMERQLEFESFKKQTDKSKFEIQKSLEKLETLKKALMQKYFG